MSKLDFLGDCNTFLLIILHITESYEEVLEAYWYLYLLCVCVELKGPYYGCGPYQKKQKVKPDLV